MGSAKRHIAGVEVSKLYCLGGAGHVHKITSCLTGNRCSVMMVCGLLNAYSQVRLKIEEKDQRLYQAGSLSLCSCLRA